MLEFRSGRIKPDPLAPKPELTEHLLAGAVNAGHPPASVDYFSRVRNWGMLGNDLWGDCTFAGDGHIAIQQTAYGLGSAAAVTTDQVLAAYATTGFDIKAGPSDHNPTDRGALIQTALKYLRDTGIAGFKIVAYGHVKPSSHMAIKHAIDEFGILSIGMDFPSTGMAQFHAGEDFDVVPGAEDGGGHCMVACGYDAKYVYVVTWGKICRMTWAFWDAYVDEAWAVITEAWKAVAGIDLAEFGKDFADVTGAPNPFAPPEPLITVATEFYNWLHKLIKGES